VKIMVPLFKDEKTDTTPEEGAGGSPGIFMDAMAFGMGCNCLQVTFQAQDVAESRHLYVMYHSLFMWTLTSDGSERSPF
jgi:hypothetical protein